MCILTTQHEDLIWGTARDGTAQAAHTGLSCFSVFTHNAQKASNKQKVCMAWISHMFDTTVIFLSLGQLKELLVCGCVVVCVKVCG